MSPRSSAPSADRLAQLLERSAEGDQQAFAQFYESTADRAQAAAVRVLRNPALADEVTQEAYLDAWRLCERYDRGRGSAVTWLLTLVHRRAVDRVRANLASAAREQAYRHREPPNVETDSTSATALASIEARRIRGALAILSAGQRRAIDLAYFDGLSHVEVAAMVGAPLGTVKYWIRSGLRRLRPILDGAASEAA